MDTQTLEHHARFSVSLGGVTYINLLLWTFVLTKSDRSPVWQARQCSTWYNLHAEYSCLVPFSIKFTITMFDWMWLNMNIKWLKSKSIELLFNISVPCMAGEIFGVALFQGSCVIYVSNIVNSILLLYGVSACYVILWKPFLWDTWWDGGNMGSMAVIMILSARSSFSVLKQM